MSNPGGKRRRGCDYNKIDVQGQKQSHKFYGNHFKIPIALTVQIDLTDSESLSPEPVPMPEFVGIPVHGELVEGGVGDEDLAENACPGADDAVVKKVGKGKERLDALVNLLKIALKPDLREPKEKYNNR